MAKETSYGKRGGIGPGAGKRTATYLIRFNGITYQKRRRYVADVIPPESMIATGFMHLGQPKFALWDHTPAWEGEFGRLTATLETK